MFDLNKIKNSLKTEYIGQTIIQFDELKSTVYKAKSIFDNCPDGTVIISENQTNSKMRFGRQWISYPDKNIYLSIILKPPIQCDLIINKLEPVALTSVCKAVNNISNEIASNIKWPNDILLNNKKISSISLDKICKNNKKEGVILSIGINVNIDDELDESIKHIATSIKKETNMFIDRELFISCILNTFEINYDNLVNFNNIDDSISFCISNSVLIGKYIETYKKGKRTLSKMYVKDIDKEGSLVVLNDEGVIEILNSGEISIKYE